MYKKRLGTCLNNKKEGEFETETFKQSYLSEDNICFENRKMCECEFCIGMKKTNPDS